MKRDCADRQMNVNGGRHSGDSLMGKAEEWTGQNQEKSENWHIRVSELIFEPKEPVDLPPELYHMYMRSNASL